MSATPDHGMFDDRLVAPAGTIAILVGVVGSVALFLRASQRKGPPPLLIVLFVVWLLSPYVLLVAARLFAKRWPPRSRSWIHLAAVVVAALSLVAYRAAALRPSEPTTAGFVLLAPVCWLITAIAVAIAAVSARRPD